MELRFQALNEQNTPAEPQECRLWLNGQDASQPRAFAETILTQGTAALANWSESCRVLFVSTEPTLDDMLGALFVEAIHEGRPLPPNAEKLARYAALVRSGHLPGDVPPEHSLGALHSAIRNLTGGNLQDSASAGPFLRQWRALAPHMFDAEFDPFTQPVALTDPDFAEEREFLRKDRIVYDQDVRKRGRRFLMRIPDESGDGAALYLYQPRSILFKLWSRKDASAPGGAGYTLLLVQLEDDDWRISTDPVQRVSLKELAGRLQQAEKEKLGIAATEDPWFDGLPFKHTLIAAPHRGTRLSKKEVLQNITAWADLRPADDLRSRASHWRTPLFISLAAILSLSFIKGTDVGGRVKVAVIRGSVVNPQTDPELNELKSGGTQIPGYAVIVGVSDSAYGHLPAACRDAGAIYTLLRDHYGFSESNMSLLVDDPAEAEMMGASIAGVRSPTRDNLLQALNDIGRITQRYKDGDRTNFVFYFAGHGHPITAAREAGYLVLADAWKQSTTTNTLQREVVDRENMDLLFKRGFDMGELSKKITDTIKSTHQLILVDCCFSGFTSQTRGVEPATEGKIYAAWGKKAHVVITAGTKEEVAHEEPPSESPPSHSVFARALLEGLRPDGAGRMLADLSQDGIIADEELACYLGLEVPRRLQRMPHKTEQTPQHFTDLQETNHDWGQYLFIPTRHPTVAVR